MKIIKEKYILPYLNVGSITYVICIGKSVSLTALYFVSQLFPFFLSLHLLLQEGKSIQLLPNLSNAKSNLHSFIVYIVIKKKYYF